MNFSWRAVGPWLAVLPIVAVGFLAGIPAALAQTITATVRGTVTDPQGAVMAGTRVVATNDSTHVSTSTVTNHDGSYSIQFLPIGSYTLAVTSAGFKSVTIGPFPLQIDQIAKVDAHLEVGAASATVSVSADVSPLLQTEDATLGTTISGNSMVNMPINGLNYQFPTLFVPGAVLPSLAYMAGADGNERNADWWSSPSFNGARGQNNNYVMDGVEIDETLNNYSGYNPAPDSIQEMRVITGNANAEYGNVSGGEVLVVTKGGTNQMHGSVYEFFQNNEMSAKFPIKISTPIRYDVYANTAHSIHYRPLRVQHRTVQNWFGTDPSAIPCLKYDANGNNIDNGTCAYGTESYNEFGNAQNGSERAPGFRQVDLSAFKTFHITETHTLELRGDAFNALNIASYGAPNASLTAYRPNTQGFGLITNTLSSQRVMQVSMHYKF